MRVLRAKDYGYRKAITVVLNPDDPEAVHIAGYGTKTSHTGTAPAGKEALKSWEWCIACRYNWQEFEMVWTNNELYNFEPERSAKPEAQLITELKAAYAAINAGASQNIGSLTGQAV